MVKARKGNALGLSRHKQTTVTAVKPPKFKSKIHFGREKVVTAKCSSKSNDADADADTLLMLLESRTIQKGQSRSLYHMCLLRLNKNASARIVESKIPPIASVLKDSRKALKFNFLKCSWASS